MGQLLFPFCHNCFWHIRDVKSDVSDVQLNASNKITDVLSCLREVGMASIGDFWWVDPR